MDISKCNGKNCPKKTSCVRYTAKSNKYMQSYIEEQYREGECEFYINNT